MSSLQRALDVHDEDPELAAVLLKTIIFNDLDDKQKNDFIWLVNHVVGELLSDSMYSSPEGQSFNLICALPHACTCQPPEVIFGGDIAKSLLLLKLACGGRVSAGSVPHI